MNLIKVTCIFHNGVESDAYINADHILTVTPKDRSEMHKGVVYNTIVTFSNGVRINIKELYAIFISELMDIGQKL